MEIPQKKDKRRTKNDL